MTLTKNIKAKLDRLQAYAGTYFDLIFRTSFNFWDLPRLPSGANILNGGFAIVLITLARAQMSQSVEAQTVGTILVSAFFIVLLVSGILTVFDHKIYLMGQAYRIAAWRKLVAVVSVTITLGCAFIVLDKIIRWIDIVFWAADKFNLSTEAANGCVASVSAIFATSVILANTAYRTAPVPLVRNRRVMVWTGVIFAIVIVGINLLISASGAIW